MGYAFDGTLFLMHKLSTTITRQFGIFINCDATVIYYDVREDFMSDIIINLLESRCTELFTFELKNRAFFERVGFPRGDNYYELNNFNTILKKSIEEQQKGLINMYLIKNHNGMILGRINFIINNKRKF